MCDEELQLSLSSWNIGSSGRRAATQPPSTAKPLRASSYRSAADILAHCSTFSAHAPLHERMEDVVTEEPLIPEVLRSKEPRRTASQQHADTVSRTRVKKAANKVVTRLPTRSASISYVQSQPRPSPVTDIIIVPSCERGAPAALEASNEQQLRPQKIDVHLQGVPFLPDGYHRIWNGAALVSQQASNVVPSHRAHPPLQALAYPNSVAEEKCSSDLSSWALLWRRLEFLAALPRVARAYIYVMLHLCFVMTLLYWMYRFVSAFRRDIHSRILIHRRELLAKAKICGENYVANRCAPEFRVPALASLCAEWEVCMHADSNGTLRETAMSAEILGHVIHSFFEQFSCKSVLLLGGSLAVAIFGSYYLSLAFRKGAVTHSQRPVYIEPPSLGNAPQHYGSVQRQLHHPPFTPASLAAAQ